jgi:hypothetical protein
MCQLVAAAHGLDLLQPLSKSMRSSSEARSGFRSASAKEKREESGREWRGERRRRQKAEGRQARTMKRA